MELDKKLPLNPHANFILDICWGLEKGTLLFGLQQLHSGASSINGPEASGLVGDLARIDRKCIQK